MSRFARTCPWTCKTLDEHLFRHESGRLIAVLTGQFGIRHLPQVEDAVQDAFSRALEVWPFRGTPASPGAWLYTTARRRLLDSLRRDRTARLYAEGTSAALRDQPAVSLPRTEVALQEHEIEDELLRMMFTCCHPRLPEEAQVALVLNVLCGFSASEVAAAFVMGLAAAEKRISRAKHALASTPALFNLSSPEEFTRRLPNVHKALYLLFNGGYHGASPESPVRAEVCREAMRLTALLLKHPLGRTPATYALGALMCLTAARIPGKVGPDGQLRRLADQDRSLWDRELVRDGMGLLTEAGVGGEVTAFHFEAGIAAYHAMSPDWASTDWKAILGLYNELLKMRPSPVIALNRAIALAEAEGADQGLKAIEAIEGKERLERYPYYFTGLGDLSRRVGRMEAARRHFLRASELVESQAEKLFLLERVRECTPGPGAS
jgi:RNA polymerase sigma factor (sigma-70 family)